MTTALQAIAKSIVEDPQYRETLRTRAQAGTLPPDVELYLLEMADGRTPVSDQERQELHNPTPHDLAKRRMSIVYSS